MRNTAALFILLTALVSFATAQSGIDLYKHDLTFTGYGDCSKERPCADLDLFRDAANNRIGNACLQGASRAELEKLGLTDLDSRLKALVDGNVLVIEGGKYEMAIPVLVGKKRDEVDAVVRQKAERISPQVAVMLGKIQAAVPEHREMAFHLLWFVMDNIWGRTWQREHRVGDGAPRLDWIIYPEHPFMFGNNSWGNYYVHSWGPHNICPFGVLPESRVMLLKAAWKQGPVTRGVAELEQMGLVDADGNFQGFSYRAGDPLDKLLEQLTEEYAALVTNAYDYDSLAASLNISSDKLFVILLHETAYSVFENLSRSGKLQIPSVLQGKGDLSACRDVVSLRLEWPVTPQDEIEKLYADSGWRGDQATIDACTEALRSNPKNARVLSWLGLSQYQLGKYTAALVTFKKISDLAAGSSEFRDVEAHIWMGHLYDLLGEREKAVEQYKEALKSGAADTVMNYSGYGIGPISAREWVEARIKTPYTRK